MELLWLSEEQGDPVQTVPGAALATGVVEEKSHLGSGQAAA